MLFQPALASEPIVQNLIVIMLSALAPTEIIKLENAVNNALTTVPARISLVVVIFPCPAAIPRTITVAITAPTNAPPETNAPSPITISRVAPNVAPDDTPNIHIMQARHRPTSQEELLAISYSRLLQSLLCWTNCIFHHCV